MGEHKSGKDVTNERRTFLRTGGLGALAVAMGALAGREGRAADVQYNKEDMARVNKKLRSSARERKAFNADPQGYLKRHGVNVPKEMIPSKREVEEALTAKPGTVIGNGKATAGMILLTIVVAQPDSAAKPPARTPAKRMR
jgi:hypothetical protein